MSSLLARSFAAFLALSLTACVSFSNGVVDKPMANDERLIGYWEIIGEKPNGAMTISADSPTSLSITLYGYEEAGCRKDTPFTAVRTQIGDRDFLDLGKVIPIGYEFRAPDHLAIFTPDDDSFAQAIEAKELAGKITKPEQNEQQPFIRVDASTADLRQWTAAHPAAMHDKPIEFVRRDPASAPHCG